MVKVRRADLLVSTASSSTSGPRSSCRAPTIPSLPRRARARRRLARHPGARGADHARRPLDGRRAPARQPALHARPGHGAVSHRQYPRGAGARGARSTAPAFETNRAGVPGPPRRRRWRAGRQRWSRSRAPRSSSYHPDFVYLLTRFGLVQAGTIEDRPGIPPTPSHLARLIQQMKDEQVKVVVVEPWSDVKLAERVAEEAGAKALRPGARRWARSRAPTPTSTTVDYNVKTLAEALAGSRHGRRPPRADVGAVPDVPGAHRHPRLSRASTSSRGRSCSWTSRWPRSPRSAPPPPSSSASSSRPGSPTRSALGFTILGAARPRADAQPRAARLAGGGDRRRLRGLRGGRGAARRPLAPRRRAPARHAGGQHPERAAAREVLKVAALYAPIGALPLALPAAVLPHLHRSRRAPTARAGACAGGTSSSTPRSASS